MKAKFYTAILSALLLTGLTASGQLGDNRNFRNDEAGVVINNYYDDYDYYYSSRINRFHRSYSAFDYYSPVFTESYWYNWQPFSWGVSIYGRSGFGFGYAINYPVYYGPGYNDWYGYDYGWYDPYYGSSWYWGYDPFYYSWYSPVIININFRNRWAHNSWGWYGHNHYYNGYRPVYNTYNYYGDYRGTRYSSREFSDSRSTLVNRTNSGGVSRRQSVPATGRESNPALNNRNTNNGNNQNSRLDGNNGNFDRNTRNTNNNGNNRNSQTNGNNGNFNNRNNGGEKGNPTSPASTPPVRRYEQTAPARTQNSSSGRSTFSAPSRSSSSSRTGSTMSQGRGSSSSRSGSSVSQGRSSSSSSRSSGSSSKSSGSSSSSKSRRK